MYNWMWIAMYEFTSYMLVHQKLKVKIGINLYNTIFMLQYLFEMINYYEMLI